MNFSDLGETKSYSHQLRRSRHRGLVWVEMGPDSKEKHSDIVSILEPLRTQFIFARSLTIDFPGSLSDQLPSDIDHCSSNQRLDSILGREYDAIFWHLEKGLNPDALGAFSGLLKAGGLLFLFVDSIENFHAKPDPDYLRMCASKDLLDRCETYYLQRCAEKLMTPNVSRLMSLYMLLSIGSENGHTASRPPALELVDSTKIKLTEQQALVQKDILDLAKSDKDETLVLTADRGRGKTHLLGATALKLIKQDPNSRIVLTAPNKRAVLPALSQIPTDMTQIQFFAPDDVLSSLPSADLLLVDEAASLPVALLNKLLFHYERIVFTSTIHGYEGCGQGFSVRFKHSLDQLRPNWIAMELDEPVRWAKGDPLEKAVNETLLLNATLPIADETSRDDKAVKNNNDQIRFWAPSKRTLFEDNILLEQIVSLLVTAHYQTSPSDIRLILDHPSVSLVVASSQGGATGSNVFGVVLCLKEDLTESLMAENDANPRDIVDGARRLRGFLVPQNLARFHNDVGLFSQKSLRIVRIAVHPNVQRRGLGMRLLSYCQQEARKEKRDYLSVAYGFTNELHAFWSKARFQSQKLGYQRDKSSGVRSMIAALPLSPIAAKTFSEYRDHYSQHLHFGLDRYYFDVSEHEKDSLLNEIQLESQEMKRAESCETEAIERFSTNKITEFDVAIELYEFTKEQVIQGNLDTLGELEASLIKIRILHNRDWKDCIQELNLRGLKHGQATLRKGFENLLKRSTES